MTNVLKVALVVPDYTHRWDDDRQFRLSELTQACHAGEIDLAVFPEAYECVPVAEARETVAWWASTLKTPVLMGVESDGFQLAVYRNPHPRGEDSPDHVYAKHSTATRLAYEWPGYQGADDPMFMPIRLKGECLGVHICHDMFYGLIGQRLRGTGARVLIDLTAGNVNIAKWRNVVRARSLELEGPFLCTMGYSPGRSGAAAALAYQAGRPLFPISDVTRPGGAGGYVLFALGGCARQEAQATEGDGGQAYTDKIYTAITLSLGTAKPADVIVRPTGEGVEVTGRGAGGGRGRWLGFRNGAGRIGVLPLPLPDLASAGAFHRLDAAEGDFDHHILLYHSPAAPERMGDVLSLMKLRAIEHRVGVALLAGEVKEVLKTSRYKNIQRFTEIDGVFGLNAEFLGGTWTTAGSSSLQGVPRRWFARYRSLVGSTALSTTIADRT